MKKIVSVILTLALALGLALPAVAEDAIKIGVIGPLTGPAAIYGTAVVNAAKIAADEVNALGGLQIEKYYKEVCLLEQPFVKIRTSPSPS